MEENKPSQNVPVIDLKALIDIQISGYFYKKIQAIFMSKCNQFSKEELVKMFKKIATGAAPETTLEAEIQVYMILCHDIEKAAKEQGKLQMKSVDELIGSSSH